MTLAQDPDVRRVDRYRGHAFMPSDDVLADIPRLYATEHTSLDDTNIWLHYFAGSADWWVAEIDAELAFGYACLGDPACAEWGYTSLRELATLYVPAASMTVGGGKLVDPLSLQPTFAVRAPIVVERDLHWTPATWRDVTADPSWRARFGER